MLKKSIQKNRHGDEYAIISVRVPIKIYKILNEKARKKNISVTAVVIENLKKEFFLDELK